MKKLLLVASLFLFALPSFASNMMPAKLVGIWHYEGTLEKNSNLLMLNADGSFSDETLILLLSSHYPYPKQKQLCLVKVSGTLHSVDVKSEEAITLTGVTSKIELLSPQPGYTQAGCQDAVAHNQVIGINLPITKIKNTTFVINFGEGERVYHKK